MIDLYCGYSHPKWRLLVYFYCISYTLTGAYQSLPLVQCHKRVEIFNLACFWAMDLLYSDSYACCLCVKVYVYICTSYKHIYIHRYIFIDNDILLL